MSACDSCSATIVWALTTSGKRMPLDVPSTPDGNLWAWREGNGAWHVSSAWPTEPPEPPTSRVTIVRVTSHFATCPNAAAHRKKRTP